MFEAENGPILGNNLTAVDAISTKLAEVTHLAEKLDARLCEAGARTRPMSIPTNVATSSASSLLSISGLSPSSATIRTASNTAASLNMTATAVPVISQMHPINSGTVATRVKSDVIKSIIPSTEKFDENLHHTHSHSTENVDSWNRNFNIKELTENSHSESATGEYNVEGYTTATECSTSPPPRSRSESFVTSPECEDLSITPTTTYSDFIIGYIRRF